MWVKRSWFKSTNANLLKHYYPVKCSACFTFIVCCCCSLSSCSRFDLDIFIVFSFVLYVTMIQGQDDWGVTYSSTEICAFKGSAVDISCTYRYSSSSVKRVENRFLFRTVQNENYVDLKNEPRYSSCVQCNCGNNDCTLKITDLRERDSAEQMKHTLSFVEHYFFKLRNGKKSVSILVLKI